MSFWKDDFYNTRVSRRAKREWEPRRRNPNRLVIVSAVSVLAGMLLMLTLVQWFGGGEEPLAADVHPNAASVPVYDINDRVVAAGDKVRPAVVSIISTMKDGDKVKGIGMGSGVIFQKSGDRVRIVTNNHVVDGGTSVEVVLSDSERKKAEVIGRDMYSDLAVLETDAAGVKAVAEFGNSDELKPGQAAIAIGNPLGLSFSQTTTVGVISSPLRTIPVYLGADGEVEWEMDVIQTDAAINQGNSGGALVSLDGKVIGINSMKISDAGVEGLGFAIPINSAKPVLDALIKDHKIKRPKMGITSEDVQSFKSGLEVLKLPEDVKTGIIVNDVTGPAKDAGLKTHDVIVELDGKPVASTMQLRKYLFTHKKIGDELIVTYYRAGKKASATVKLAELD
ncbi:trypsin-like peptidase domain-containing protein [Paenibacillus sp. CC-CFT747]|nr:trypsin-like peptidase domain-containing protein [Paenibacillus sp. CC-CFT747]